MIAYDYYLYKAYETEHNKYKVKNEIVSIGTLLSGQGHANSNYSENVMSSPIVMGDIKAAKAIGKISYPIFPFFKYFNPNSFIPNSDLAIYESEIEILESKQSRSLNAKRVQLGSQSKRNLGENKNSNLILTEEKEDVIENELLNEENSLRYFNIITIDDNKYLLIVRSSYENIYLTSETTIKNLLVPYERRLKMIFKLKSALKKNFVLHQTRDRMLNVSLHLPKFYLNRELSSKS